MKKILIIIFVCIFSFTCCKKDNNPIIPETKWEKINIGVGARTINDLQFFNNTLFAGTDSGICISSDAGITWKNYNTPDRKLNVRKLFFDGNVIFAGTKDAGIFVSNDFGVTWSPTNQGIRSPIEPYFPEISSFISDSIYIYAGLPALSLNTPKPAQIYRRRKDQAAWEPFDAGVEHVGVRTFYKYDNRIHAGTWEGIFVYEPVLSKWIKFGESNLSFIRFYMKKSILFCSVEQQDIGIMTSTNGGFSWKISNSGFDFEDMVWSFSVDNKTNIYCTSYGTLFLSSNEGNTWVKIGDGLPQESILSSVVVDNNIFVGTSWNGVWKFKL